MPHLLHMCVIFIFHQSCTVHTNQQQQMRGLKLDFCCLVVLDIGVGFNDPVQVYFYNFSMHLYLLPDYPISDQFFVITRVIFCKLFQKISFWIFAMFTVLPIFFDHVQMSLYVLYFIWKYSLFRLNKQRYFLINVQAWN